MHKLISFSKISKTHSHIDQDLIRLDIFAQHCHRPTLVLYSSGIVVVNNDGSKRLFAASDHLGASEKPLVHRSVYDLGTALIPNRKPIYRDLSALFAAAVENLDS